MTLDAARGDADTRPSERRTARASTAAPRSRVGDNLGFGAIQRCFSSRVDATAVHAGLRLAAENDDAVTVAFVCPERVSELWNDWLAPYLRPQCSMVLRR